MPHLYLSFVASSIPSEHGFVFILQKYNDYLMYTKTNNALVNHLSATSLVARLQCFHRWGCVSELNFWQFFFSIFQLFLVLLSHVVCRNVYYNKPWHEGNGGLVVGAVHSKPHVVMCLVRTLSFRKFSHFYMNPSPSNFPFQFSVAEWVCPSPCFGCGAVKNKNILVY